MKAKLTARTVQAAQPQAKPYRITDTEIRGYHLRVQPSGVKAYYLRFTLHGARHVMHIGDAAAMTPTQARAAAQHALTLIQQGQDPRNEKPERDVTVRGLARDYIGHARSYYSRSSEADNVARSMARLTDAYGRHSIEELTPRLIKALMERMVKDGASRSGVNRTLAHIKRFLKWAVSEEACSPTVLHAAQTVSGLRKGATEAFDHEPVSPVAPEDVERVKPYLSPPLRAVVELLRLTGARPSEILALRPRDIDTSKPVWEAAPEQHKTRHHGKIRIIFFGPRAQLILKPYMLREADAYLFNPREGLAQARQGKVGRRPGQKETPRQTARRVGNHYSVQALRKSIARACEAEGIEVWNPYRLRHTAATEIRAQHGLEAAQVILGHAELGVTQVYAEKNQALARRIAADMG